MECGVGQFTGVYMECLISDCLVLYLNFTLFNNTKHTYIYKWNHRREHKTLTEINSHFVKIRDHCVMSKIGHGKV